MKLSDVRSVGARTEMFFDLHAGVVEERADYLVTRHPDNPGYWFGNSLFFPLPPGPSDFERWMDLSRSEFSDSPDIHRTFRWDSASGELGESASFLAAGFLVENCDVLIAQDASQLEPERNSTEFEQRRLCGDADWSAAFELALITDREEFGFESPEHVAYLQKRYDHWRKLAEAELGEWWGVFRGDRLVSDLGIYFTGELARFQSVKTHPDYRRQGHCRQLVSCASRAAFQKRRDRKLVLLAAQDSWAGRIYRSVGYRPCEVLPALLLRPKEYRDAEPL